MEVVHDAGPVPSLPNGSIVTIGAYDGVHRGHRMVIEHVRRLAAERGTASAVVTFDRHPASVVRPDSAPHLLCDLDQKLELLASTGVDMTFLVRFDEVTAKEDAVDFVDRVLVDALAARHIVVGADFHFGNRRLGNVALLGDLGPSRGFTVEGMALVDADGRPARDETRVSSTAIRRLLVAGRVGLAAELLGRVHEVRGVVQHGDKRGRDLGFPTANVAVPDEILLPADGIYAGWLERPTGERLPAAISLGRRPTFYVEQAMSLLEVHALDWSGDLYDERVRVGFVEWLRGEAKFDAVDDLVAQIARDCDDARRILGRA